MPLLHALRHRLRHSIRDRLIAMSCLIVLAVVCALTLVIALAAAGMLRQAAEQELSQELEQSSALLSNFLAVRESNLKLWAANPLSEAMFSDPALAAVFSPSLRSYFADARSREPWIAHILLMRKRQVIYDDSGGFEAHPGAPAVAAWLQGLPNGALAVLDMKRLDPRLDQRALVLKRPLIKEGAALKGAFIILVLDLDQVQRALFERMRIGEHGFVAIAAALPQGRIAVPSRIAAAGESQAEFLRLAASLTRLNALPPQSGSLVIRYRALPPGPLALIGVASRHDIRAPITQLILYSGAFGLLALLAGALGAVVYARRLTQPILELSLAAQALKQGNLADPIVCAGEDEIGLLAQSLESTRQSLAGLVADLESRVRQRTQDLSRKSEEVARLLDNSGQGFLSIGADLSVGSGYSRECVRLFGRDIQGLALPDLLAPDDRALREHVAKTLRLAIGSADNALRREAFLNLLPAEYQLDERSCKAEYRPLSEERMMLILTDISAQKKLQARLAREQAQQAFIVNALENRDELLEALRDYDLFRRHTLPQLLSFQQDPHALMAELFRRIHTFKGLFAQAMLPTLPDVLHALESRLGALREARPDLNDIKRALGSVDLGGALEADLALLREKLGAGYLNAGRQASVSADALDALEREVQTLGLEHSRLADLTRQLRHEPLRRLIEPHFRAARMLAQRQGKRLAPLVYEGDDPPVDPARYGPFCKSLIHVFRNAVDHGIEDPDARLMADKPEAATLRCHVDAAGGTLTIAIEDDGPGIDPARIRAAALRKKLITDETAQTLDDAGALRLILEDGLTTLADASDVSGRGVGLSATHQELLKLGGSLSIAAQPGQGTKLTFKLPYQAVPPSAADVTSQRHRELLSALAAITSQFCRDHLGLTLALDGDSQRIRADDLEAFSVFIPLGSGLAIGLGLSLSRPLLLEMVRRFEPDWSAEDIAPLADSVGAEIANIVVGKTLPYLTHLARQVEMGTPKRVDAAAKGLFDHPDSLGIRASAPAGRLLVFCLPLPHRAA